MTVGQEGPVLRSLGTLTSLPLPEIELMGKTCLVRRYQGEDLPRGSRIAVIANDALGNYVVTTPLLQMLRQRHELASLDYYSGVRTSELWSKDPNVSWGFPLFGTRPDLALKESRGPYDLVMNIESSAWAKSFASLLGEEDTLICGPCLSPDGRGDFPFANDCFGRLAGDPEWISADLVNRHGCLESGFIGEILCRMAYLTGAVPAYSVPMELPQVDVPKVLIAPAASLPQKLWGTEKWLEVLEWLRLRGISAGIVGARPEEQRRYWFGATTEDEILSRGLAVDLRGAMTLTEVVGALEQTRVCFTLDNGVLHLACAVHTPTVGLFREGYHRLWAPPSPGLEVVIPATGCAVSEIEVGPVIERLERALGD